VWADRSKTVAPRQASAVKRTKDVLTSDAPRYSCGL